MYLTLRPRCDADLSSLQKYVNGAISTRIPIERIENEAQIRPSVFAGIPIIISLVRALRVFAIRDFVKDAHAHVPLRVLFSRGSLCDVPLISVTRRRLIDIEPALS